MVLTAPGLPLESDHKFALTSKDVSQNIVVKPSAEFEKDYEIILPNMHELLQKPDVAKLLKVNLEEFISIPRTYRRLIDKLALKTYL